MSKRPTSLVYLVFSMLVGFYNIYLGRPWFFLFCIPFVISFIAPSRITKYFDLACTAIITAVSFALCGPEASILFSLVLYIQSLTVFKTNKYIYGLVVVMAIIASCVPESSGFSNKPIGILMFVALFVVSFIVTNVYIVEIKEKSSGKDQIIKCFELVDEALDVAKKSIKELKNSEGQNAGRN